MAKILIIDDEEDIRELLSYNLKKEGFIVEIAENGESGINILSSFKPDLVLLDVMMPGMDGIEVCEAIRTKEGFQNTLVCFLTARNEDYSQIAGLEAGADDYVSKPIRPKVLISRIKALLRRKGNVDVPSNEANNLIINRDRYLVEKEVKKYIYQEKNLSYWPC